eukprot:scaffold84062_cov19-Tisochrysis_lutea.AAC.4
MGPAADDIVGLHCKARCAEGGARGGEGLLFTHTLEAAASCEHRCQKMPKDVGTSPSILCLTRGCTGWDDHLYIWDDHMYRNMFWAQASLEWEYSIPCNLISLQICKLWKQSTRPIGRSNGCSALVFARLPPWAQACKQVPALAADVQTPEYCALSEDEEGGGLQAVNAWFGPAATVTPLHTDPHHNLLAQVAELMPQEGLVVYAPGYTLPFLLISTLHILPTPSMCL